ncbi:MAG TPA: hypothetical protein PKE49_17300 [Leptospiraceae bacterium]|jgi:sialic acid synthase SpsE|nr:hypothetical protein [Leptospirales bacterium]HMU82508.1 hypothetical protein [Leptospiraceae bacterium]HMW61389.1 hypothetical protein [Leptospiraceae bacterium]HMX58286.1 hypothetical protein [Leptospiraceae bacterium]HNE25354.1 hypothetical protein [Leptospiraceae bacterium]
MKERTIKVGSREIGGKRTFLIGDIGSNHNQDIHLPYETIDAGVARADLKAGSVLNWNELEGKL